MFLGTLLKSRYTAQFSQQLVSRNEKYNGTTVRLQESCCRGDALCSCCNPLPKSRAEFYFAQQNDYETAHVTLCNSLAACLATALEDKLLRKLRSVTGLYCVCVRICRANITELLATEVVLAITYVHVLFYENIEAAKRTFFLKEYTKTHLR